MAKQQYQPYGLGAYFNIGVFIEKMRQNFMVKITDTFNRKKRGITLNDVTIIFLESIADALSSDGTIIYEDKDNI